MAADQLDRDEQLLWRILYRLEALAPDRYERFAPPLAIAAKREITSVLGKGAPDEACLKESVVTSRSESFSMRRPAATRPRRSSSRGYCWNGWARSSTRP
jgi:hypothetical protein